MSSPACGGGGNLHVTHKQVLEGFYKTFLALRKLPIASIAAINGAAVGGGMGLAAAADIRLAATNARLGYNFVKLGLSPGGWCWACVQCWVYVQCWVCAVLRRREHASSCVGCVQSSTLQVQLCITRPLAQRLPVCLFRHAVCRRD